MTSIQKYLQDHLDAHCRNHVENKMGINSTDEDFEEEVQDLKQLMEMGIWRNEEIIETAYYIGVPKKALYRFGYTKEEINRIFSESFSGEYPY